MGQRSGLGFRTGAGCVGPSNFGIAGSKSTVWHDRYGDQGEGSGSMGQRTERWDTSLLVSILVEYYKSY